EVGVDRLRNCFLVDLPLRAHPVRRCTLYSGAHRTFPHSTCAHRTDSAAALAHQELATTTRSAAGSPAGHAHVARHRPRADEATQLERRRVSSGTELVDRREHRLHRRTGRGHLCQGLLYVGRRLRRGRDGLRLGLRSLDHLLLGLLLLFWLLLFLLLDLLFLLLLFLWLLFLLGLFLLGNHQADGDRVEVPGVEVRELRALWTEEDPPHGGREEGSDEEDEEPGPVPERVDEGPLRRRGDVDEAGHVALAEGDRVAALEQHALAAVVRLDLARGGVNEATVAPAQLQLRLGGQVETVGRAARGLGEGEALGHGEAVEGNHRHVGEAAGDRLLVRGGPEALRHLPGVLPVELEVDARPAPPALAGHGEELRPLGG